MLKEELAKVDPRTVRIVKISAIIVGAAVGIVVAGVVAYKLGAFNLNNAEAVEEVVATAAEVVA